MGVARREPFEAVLRQEFRWWTTASLQTLLRSSIGTSKVICVDSNNVQMAGYLILLLRNVLGYKRPIQVAYAGDEDLHLKDQSALN
jgi:hypothetical protein